MIAFRDRTFCISPDCINECGRKLTPEIEAEARQWWGAEGEPPISKGYFCGKPEDGKGEQ